MDDSENFSKKVTGILDSLLEKATKKIEEMIEETETEETEEQIQNLKLVGIAHTDEFGKESLLKYFEIEKPTKILLEGNLEFFEKWSKKEFLKIFSKIKNKKARNILEDFFAQFYLHEYEASFEYCQTNKKCSLHLIDLSLTNIAETEYAGLSDMCKKISTKKAAEEFVQFIKEKTDDTYQLFFNIFRTPPGILRNLACRSVLFKYQASLAELDFGKRDTYMAEKIRELYNPKEKTIIVTGAMHILDDPKERTLYSKIKDLNPQRTLTPLAEDGKYFDSTT